MRKKFLFLGGFILLTYLFWPTPVRPRILAGYSDSFAGIWALDLYKDGGFHLSLPAAEAEGKFRLTGDTIVLQYTPSAPQLPAAYLINRRRKKLDELKKLSDHWVPAGSSNWMTPCASTAANKTELSTFALPHHPSRQTSTSLWPTAFSTSRPRSTSP